jgi:hypothetical protein
LTSNLSIYQQLTTTRFFQKKTSHTLQQPTLSKSASTLKPTADQPP